MRICAPTIAIIGSGPTAIYTARYLLLQRQSLSITLFEAQKQAGKGTPYHQDWNDKEMLSNIASIEIPPVTETLLHWLNGKTEHELSTLGIARETITDRTFFPRVALGEYFHAQLVKLTRVAKASGSDLTVKTLHKVLDVRVAEEGFKLTIRDNNDKMQYPVFDYVVMATGHAWPQEAEAKPGYFLSPWPASALRTIPHCHVGIRGTSLSAIDALVALCVARGAFLRNAQGELRYFPEPGTEAFHVTMISRKGILPEADFYCPIPYTPLHICTAEAVDRAIHSGSRAHLLDNVFTLFKEELAACDPDYADGIDLAHLTLEEFSHIYFLERERHDAFIWAAQNLAEAKSNQERRYTVPWRYAILRMHEVIARIVPKLPADDYKRFNTFFKHVFVDDYATVPHESIERLLALHHAGKLDILRVGEDYTLDTETPACGAFLVKGDLHIHFSAFIEAMGQRPLSVHDFPFPGLWEQGLLHKATASNFVYTLFGQRFKKTVDMGGIDLDMAYHPVSDSPRASKLYCLSLPFMLGQFPFAQGITSSHEMGKKVAQDMAEHFFREDRMPLLKDVREGPYEGLQKLMVSS